MKRLVILESIYNAMDAGIFIDMINNLFKVRIDMKITEFLKHLIFGKGYDELTPPQLSQKLEDPDKEMLIIDLRDKYKFRMGHISGAVLHSFDDFLKDVLLYDGYQAYKGDHLVLVCDTGHQSRVAASVLSEERFLKVSSLKRGMRRWNRWEKMVSICKWSKKDTSHINSSCFHMTGFFKSDNK